MGLHRRSLLASASLIGGVAVAGCLERLGFERQSAWRNPPLVDNRPDAVYVPASTEEMGHYGTVTDGEYAVSLSYTFPHRFWIIAGERERVDVGVDDTLHMMATVWDHDSEIVIPADMSIEIRRDGETVTSFAPWPMLSQRMGFHYGDNVILPSEGTYRAIVHVGPLSARRTGTFDDRFDAATTLEIDFEYHNSDIHDLTFQDSAEEERGTRGALPVMDHSEHRHDSADNDHQHEHEHDHDHDQHDHNNSHVFENEHEQKSEDNYDHEHDHHDHDHGHPPTSVGPPVDTLDGDVHGTGKSADAAITVLETDLDRFIEATESAAEATYLAVFPRTPYNDVILPFTSISAKITRGQQTLVDAPLQETVDHEFGHHYGIAIDPLESGDSIIVTVDSPPQVSRHDGYETAFFDFDPVEFIV